MNKLLYLLLFLFFSNFLLAQKVNYKIDDEVLINQIKFTFKKEGRSYHSKVRNETFGIYFYRINDSISGYYKLSTESIDKLWVQDKPSYDWNDAFKSFTKISTREFDLLIKELNEIDFQSIKTPVKNYLHPTHFEVTLSNNKYSFSSEKIVPDKSVNNEKLSAFIQLCEQMMKYINIE